MVIFSKVDYIFVFYSVRTAFKFTEMCEYVIYGLKQEFARANMTMTQMLFYGRYAVLTDELIDGLLLELKKTNRGTYT